jgi:prefoldin subunit 5
MMMPATGPAPQPQSPEQEIEMLKSATEMLRQQMEAIQRRLEELGEKGG